MNEQIEHYLSILQDRPGHLPALKSLEEIYFLDNAWPELLELYHNQVEQEIPKSLKAELLFKTGMIYESQLRDTSKAMQFFRQSVEYDTNFVSPLEHLLKIHIEGNQQRAVFDTWRELEPRLKEKPQEYLRNLHRIRIYLERSNHTPEQVWPVLVRILNINPDDQEVRKMVTTAPQFRKLLSADLALMDRWVEKAKSIETRNVYKILKTSLLIRDLARREHLEETATVLEGMARQQGPQQKEVLELLFEVYRRTENYRGLAEIHIQSAKIGASPQDRLSHLEAAAKIYLERLRDNRAAENIYKKIFDLQPGNEAAFQFLSDVHEKRGDARGWIDLIGRHTHTVVDAHKRVQQFLLMGEIFHKRLGQSDKAIQCYERVIKGDPKNESALLNLLNLFEETKNAEKLSALLGTLKNFSSSGDRRFAHLIELRRARFLKDAKKDFEQALLSYEKVLKENPSSEEAVRGIVEILEQQSRWDMLVEFYGRLLNRETDPKVQERIHDELGRVYLERLQDESKAAIHFRKILQINPGHDQAFGRLEALFQIRENWGDLLHLYGQKLSAAVGDEQIFSLYRKAGKIWEEKLRDDRKAYEEYFKAFQTVATEAENLTDLRKLARRLGKDQETLLFIETELSVTAASNREALIELYQEAVELLESKASSGESQVAHEKYHGYLEKLITLNPHHLQGLRKLERIHAEKGQWPEMIAILHKALAATHTPSIVLEVHAQIARIHEEHLSDDLAAIHHWDQARRVDPSRLETLRVLFRLNQKHQRMEDLRLIGAELERGLYEQEEKAEWLAFAIGLAQLHEGPLNDLKAAEVLWQKIFKAQKAQGLSPESSLNALEGIYGRSGAWDQQAWILEKKIEVAQGSHELVGLYNQLADLYFEKQQNPELAGSLWEKSLHLRVDQPEIVKKYGAILRRAQRWREMAAFLRLQIDKGRLSKSERLRLLTELAAIHADQFKQDAEAEKIYFQIFAEDPQNIAALQKLNELLQRQGREQERVKLLERIVPLAYASKDKALETTCLEELLDLAKRGGGVAEANLVQFARRLLALHPAHEKAYAMLAAHFRRARDWREYEDLTVNHLQILNDPAKKKALMLELIEHARSELKDEAKEMQFREKLLGLKGLEVDASDLPWIEGCLSGALKSEQWNTYCLAAQQVIALIRKEKYASEKIWLAFVKLAEIFHTKLNQKAQAIDSYQQALSLFFELRETPQFKPEWIQDAKQRNIAPLLHLLKESRNWPAVIAIQERLISLLDASDERADAYYELGEIYFHKTLEFDKGVDLFTKCLEEAPQKNNAFLILEEYFTSREDWLPLVRLYEQRSEHLLDLYEVTALLARAGKIWEEKIGDRLEASLCYQKAIEIAPEDLQELWFIDRLYEIYEQQKNWSAIAKLQEFKFNSARDDAQRIVILLDLALLSEECLEDSERAYYYYKRIAEIDPGHRLSLQALVRISIESGLWRDADRCLLQLIDVLENEPRGAAAVDPDLRNEAIKYLEILGETREKRLKDFGGAILPYERILDKDPENLAALLALERLYRHTEDWPKLAATYDLLSRAEISQDERVSMLSHLGKIYDEELKNPEKAVSAYGRILREAPNHQFAYLKLVRCLEKLGRWEELVEIHKDFLRHVKSNDEGIKIIKEIALIFDERLERKEEAIPFYFQVIEGQKNLEVVERLITILQGAERWIDLERALRLKMEHVEGDLKKSIVQKDLARLLTEKLYLTDEGIELFEGVLNLSREQKGSQWDRLFKESLFLLSRCYEESGEFEKLEELLPECVRRIDHLSEKVQYLYLLGSIREKSGESLSGTVECYSQVVELTWDGREGREYLQPSLVGLTRMLLAMGKWEALRDVYDKLIALEPSVVNWKLAQGGLLLRNKPGHEELEEALNHLEAVNESMPLDLTARRQLNRALAALELWPRWIDSIKAEIALEGDSPSMAPVYEEQAEIVDMRFRKPGDAMPLLQKALSLDPARMSVRHYLVALLMQAQKFAEARDCLLEGIQYLEDVSGMQTLLAEAARIERCHLNDAPGAEAILERSFMLEDPRAPHGMTYREWFKIHEAQNVAEDQREKLLQRYEAYAQAFGVHEGPEFFFRYAQFFNGVDSERHHELLRKALAVEPGFLPALSLTGEHEFNHGNFAGALEVFTRLAQKGLEHTDDVSLLKKILVCAHREDQRSIYLKVFQRLRDLASLEGELFPSFFEIVVRMARDQVSMEEIAALVDSILEDEEALASIPPKWQALCAYWLGTASAADGRPAKEIIPLFRLVADQAPQGSSLRVHGHYELGQIFLLLEQRHQASKALEEAVEQDALRSQVAAKDSELHSIEEQMSQLPDPWRLKDPDWFEVRLRLGSLLENTDPRKAAAHYSIYVSKHPEDRDVVEKLILWYEEWQEFGPLEGVLKAALAARASPPSSVEEKSGEQQWRLRQLKRLARIRKDSLADLQGAQEAFEELLKLDPQDVIAHESLAEIYDRDGQNRQRAIEEHEFLILKDPLRLASYRSLFNHYRALGKHDRASCVAEALVLLGEDNEEVRNLAAALGRSIPVFRPGTISPDARRGLLYHPQYKRYLFELMSELRGGLDKVYPFKPDRYQVTKSDRVNEQSPAAVHAILRRANNIYRSFGGKEVRIYWDRQAQNRFALENDRIPALIISSDFFPVLSEQEQNFLMGRALHYALDGFIVLQKVRPNDLEKTLNSLLKILDPNAAKHLTKEELESTERTVLKLKHRVKKEVQALIRQHTSKDAGMSFLDWLQTLNATANRTGLLACGSLEVAVKFLSKEGGHELPLAEETDAAIHQSRLEIVRRQIKNGDILADLIGFAVSTPYFKLRELLYEKTNV